MPAQITISEFRVRMSAFAHARGVIAVQRGNISDALDALASSFKAVADNDWQSPAADTFTALSTEFSNDADALKLLLIDIEHRMTTTYHNYLAAERRIERNLGGNG